MATISRRGRGLLVIISSTVVFLLLARLPGTEAPPVPRLEPTAVGAAPLVAVTESAAKDEPAPVIKVGVRHDYIVQASSLELARNAVLRVGGEVTGELDIIRAVGAALDARELAALNDRRATIPG